MGSLDVDIEALEHLGAQLRAVRARLDGLGQNLTCFEGAVGSRRLNRRLGDLAGNWTRHRQRLGEEIEELAAMIAEAAATYRQQDTEIAAAAHRGATPADG